MKVKNSNFFLISLVFFAAGLRLLFFFSVLQHNKNSWMLPDSLQYHTTATQIASGKGMTNPDGSPQMLRLPGYPFFLAALYRTCNPDSLYPLIAQILFSCLIPLLMFLFARLLLPQSKIFAYSTATLSALHSGFLVYAGMLTSETLFMIFMIIFFITFLYALQHNSSKWMVGAGCALGTLSLIRPVGHYTLCIALLSIFMWGQQHYKTKLSLSLILPWILCISGWLIRNFLLTGHLFFHTLPGIHFLQYSAAYIVMERDQVSYGAARSFLLQAFDDTIAQQEKHTGRRLNEYERCVVAENIAKKYMVNYPYFFAKTAAIQILKTCCSLYMAQPLLSDEKQWPEYTNHTPLWVKIKRFLMPCVNHPALIFFIYYELLYTLLLMIGVIIFLFMCITNRWARTLLLQCLPFIGMFIFITLAYGCARLRLPIEPCIMLFSGIGWGWIIQKNLPDISTSL